MEIRTLSLDDIRIDGGTQPRVAIDEATVVEYAEALHEGVSLPPVTVFHDGAAWWLADGFHRYHAHRRAKLDHIAVEVHDGTLREAVLYSVGANTEHGLRRSNGDKRKAALTLLKDDEWSSWSAREIARRCHVSESYIRQLKASHTAHCAQYESSERTFVHHKTGKATRMQTARIGQAAKRRPAGEGRIAKEAYRPRQFHGEDGPVPMRTISLPLNNPQQAARSMIGLYGEDYIRQLVHELNLILKGEPSND